MPIRTTGGTLTTTLLLRRVALLALATALTLFLAASAALANPEPILLLELVSPPENPGMVITPEIVEKTRKKLLARVSDLGARVEGNAQARRLFVIVPAESNHKLKWWRETLAARGRLEFKKSVYNPKTGDAWALCLGGDIVRRADWVIEPRPGVVVELTVEGRVKMADLSRQMGGKTLGIFVDGELVSAPRVMEPVLDGTFQIGPLETPEQAEDLARKLMSTLPVSVKVVGGE